MQRWLRERWEARVGNDELAARSSSAENKDPVVIYSTRGGGDMPSAENVGVLHGRVVDWAHEQDIIELIRRAMARHGRHEQLVVHSGKDAAGKIMSIREQQSLFERAHVVIGPHGGALANLLWMDPTKEGAACAERPAVVEFLCSQKSIQVQPFERPGIADGRPPARGECPWGRTYWRLFGTTPWLRYHHVLYAENSTSDRTFVNLNHLDDALDAVFARGTAHSSPEASGSSTSCLVGQAAPAPLTEGYIQHTMRGRVLPTRLITQNHKTGHRLSFCIARMCEHFGVDVKNSAGHISGGFRPSIFQLNHVRDIFATIDSAYTFHKTGPEPWTTWRLAEIKNGPTQAIKDKFGKGWLAFIPTVNAAMFGLNNLARKSPQSCQTPGGPTLVSGTKLPIEVGGHSYASLLKSLDLADGLLMEAFRSLHRNVPFIVASTIDCQQVNAKTTALSGGCSSVLLDDIMADYDAGFNLIAAALNLQALNGTRSEMAAYFDRHCNPLPSNATGINGTQPARKLPRKRAEANKQIELHQHHLVNQHTATDAERKQRPARIELLRKLDQLYLGGAIASANLTVYQNAARSSTASAA
jgi:hypothetical protein